MSLVEIPQPPPRLILGNVPELRRKASVIESLIDVAREYGEIFKLQTPRGRLVVISDADLAAELCDEERFDKVLGAPLLLIRKRIGPGLFTSWTHEKEWGQAHRILMPTFSHASMKAYVPDMVEIAGQLMEHLESHSGPVDIPAEMTKLTLDTIALCGFSFRFDSFRRTEQHPFVEAMVEVLTEQQNQAARPAALNKIMVGSRRRMEASSKIMDETVLEIIRRRRSGGKLQGREDLLEHMLHGVDKVTGESLTDLNIKAQCITFLVAGHETTSGLLSFALYYLMKNPALAVQAQAETDRVLGSDPNLVPTYEQIHSLDFLGQVLDEALRLWPTAPAFNRGPRSEAGETIGGKYYIPHGQSCLLLLPMIHRSVKVWGSDAAEFNPDRFSPEAKAQRPDSVFLPFGTGARACIGRQFAIQEAKLVLGMLLQRFDLVDSNDYQLRIKQSLTIKPDGFFLTLRRRALAQNRPSLQTAAPPNGSQPETAASQAALQPGKRLGLTLQVLHGSNLGTCEGYASELAREAGRRGFEVVACALDDAIGQLADSPAVLLCSSYNGTPPDNALAFSAWLDGNVNLPGTPFAVFGCGNREWSNTYQKIPRGFDQTLASKGGRRLLPLGEGDASGDLDAAYRAWKEAFWSSLYAHFGLLEESVAPQVPLYSVELLEDLHPNPFAEVYEATAMVIVENRELQERELSSRSTRHIELALPTGAAYRAGDHLGVIPQNSSDLVSRVASVFGLTPETRIQLHKRQDAQAALPTERILSVGTLLTHYVELQEVATGHQLGLLAGYAENISDKRHLEALASDRERYSSEIKAQHCSLVDVLERYPSTRLPFGHYLELVSPLRPRYYSISSSPEASGRILSLTVGVVDGPARSGLGQYRGTCSNYLANVARGQAVYAFVQDVHGMFGLPSSPSTPIIMIGAGTGVAPYRGFLQERAAAKRAGHPVGKALLFFGCRHPGHDDIYSQEFLDHEAAGLVEIVKAYSRESEGARVYVQDRILEQADKVTKMLEEGAVLYVCGDASGMASGVRQALAQAISQQVKVSLEEANVKLDSLVADGRYLLDVWASS